MKTRREHLQVLPDEILEEVKKEVLETRSPEELLSLFSYICDKEEAFKGLFIFSLSEKGHKYWWSIYEKYFD